MGINIERSLIDGIDKLQIEYAIWYMYIIEYICKALEVWCGGMVNES